MQEVEKGGARPGLWPIGARIQGRKGMLPVARVSAENFGQAVKVEQRCSFKHGAGQAFGQVIKSKTNEAQSEDAVLHRPHRTAMIGIRIKRGMLAGKGA